MDVNTSQTVLIHTSTAIHDLTAHLTDQVCELHLTPSDSSFTIIRPPQCSKNQLLCYLNSWIGIADVPPRRFGGIHDDVFWRHTQNFVDEHRDRRGIQTRKSICYRLLTASTTSVQHAAALAALVPDFRSAVQSELSHIISDAALQYQQFQLHAVSL